MAAAARARRQQSW